MKLSIIIPNYNEKENLQRGVLNEVNSYLQHANFDWEVIISDDGSTDGSRQLVSQFAKKNKKFVVVANQHGGKAQAVWAGIQAATGDFVLFTDMDQSTPLNQVEKIIPFFEKYDVVIGSRGRKRDASLFRKIQSVVFLSFRRSLLLRDIIDTQCGFKALKHSVAIKLFPQLETIRKGGQVTGWVVSAFDVELLFLAEKNGHPIKEVSVEWKDRDVSTGKSKNFLTESIDMLKQIFRVKLNDLQGKYQLS